MNPKVEFKKGVETIDKVYNKLINDLHLEISGLKKSLFIRKFKTTIQF